MMKYFKFIQGIIEENVQTNARRLRDFWTSLSTEKEDESIMKVKGEMGSFLKDIGLLEAEDMIPLHKWRKLEESDDDYKTLLTVLVILERLVGNTHTSGKTSEVLLANY
jgi:hypothetical protein